MLRVTTLHAASAAATATYYAQYLTAAPGEVPGVWCGPQAAGLGLVGQVDVTQLESLLSGHDPTTGAQLGGQLLDRLTVDGRVVRAVSGFDATFSAPKSLSVWWALTGDARLLESHDVAVAAALTHLERFGSTTRIRSNGRRMHPDTDGLTMATFRQTTSRADDPQIHTHAVISAKVHTSDGRWLALDARYLKRHQRMLGGLYQSVLRNELTHRFGVDWLPIRNGQAELAGIPDELLQVFSKRTVAIDAALADKIDDFRQREGRTPSRWERAALTREASADTRAHKSGNGAADLTTRWRSEAARVGWTADQLEATISRVATRAIPPAEPTVYSVVDALSQQRSSWSRADVVQAICDVQPPVSNVSGHRWAETLERATDRVLEGLVDLDPPAQGERRASDRRSVWIEPTAANFTSEPVLAQEEAIITWAMSAQAEPTAPSTTVNVGGLDPLQAAAAAAVAGTSRLTLVVGPAGAGKTRMLKTAGDDLTDTHRAVFAVAPTAKAARTLQRDTAISADTVAKLLYEWGRPDRPPRPDYQLPAGTTLIVDEAGMLSTPALHEVINLADRNRWRLALVGDPQQLQGVGRGGLLAELCANGRVERLEQLHRFANRWEAAASLMLRSGHPQALNAYEAHGRIVPGTLDEHLNHLAAEWIENDRDGRSVALVASTNDHVDLINDTVQRCRLLRGDIDQTVTAGVAGGEQAYVGDLIATRRNDRRLVTTAGEPVRNRDTWKITGVQVDGSITASHQGGHGTVVLPGEYLRAHVRLGYAATEHGWQSDTVRAAFALASAQTTRRGLYVAATRGTDENVICVVTDSDDIAEARDVLEGVLALDRADTPAVAQRRALSEQSHSRVGRAQMPPPPRCAIPDWFDTYLTMRRAERHDLKRVEADRATKRDILGRELSEAERALADRAVASAPARHALNAAHQATLDANEAVRASERRLDAAPWRRRGPVREQLNASRDRLDHAKQLFDLTKQQTRLLVDTYSEAVNRRDAAYNGLHHHDLAHLLDSLHDPIAAADVRIHALEAWRAWAEGQAIDPDQIRTTIAALSDRWPVHTPDGELADSLAAWTRTQQIDARGSHGRDELGLGR